MRARPFAFRTDGLTLEGEVVLPERARGVVVLCHGLPAGGPPDPEAPGYAGFAREVATLGVAAAWFNFRGCRGAPGDFSLGGWCRDLAAALDALAGLPETAGLRLVVAGSSAGGSAAITVAAGRPDVRAVATLAAPASFSFGGLASDPDSLLQRLRNTGLVRDPAFPPDVDAWAEEFEALAAERHVAAVAPRPLLLVHGEADDIVSYAHAERLFAAAGEPKELVRVPGAGHRLRHDPRVLDVLGDWLDGVLGR